MKRPRVLMHDDGLFVSIGVDDSPDTILKVGGHDGPGGWRDVARAREWVDLINALLVRAELDVWIATGDTPAANEMLI